jgi:hypothetical protein
LLNSGFRERVDATIEPDYLRLTLQEEEAARRSVSVEARKRHEELAIIYESRLFETHSYLSEGAKRIKETS